MRCCDNCRTFSAEFPAPQLPASLAAKLLPQFDRWAKNRTEFEDCQTLTVLRKGYEKVPDHADNCIQLDVTQRPFEFEDSCSLRPYDPAKPWFIVGLTDWSADNPGFGFRNHCPRCLPWSEWKPFLDEFDKTTIVHSENTCVPACEFGDCRLQRDDDAVRKRSLEGPTEETTAKKPKTEQPADDVCAICLSALWPTGTETTVVKLPCEHFFHHCCLTQWRLKSPSCPLCRRYSNPVVQLGVEVTPDYTEDGTLSYRSDPTGVLHCNISLVWPQEMIDDGFATHVKNWICDVVGYDCDCDFDLNKKAEKAGLDSELAYVETEDGESLSVATYYDKEPGTRDEEEKDSYEDVDRSSERGQKLMEELRWYTQNVLVKIFEKFFKGHEAASEENELEEQDDIEEDEMWCFQDYDVVEEKYWNGIPKKSHSKLVKFVHFKRNYLPSSS